MRVVYISAGWLAFALGLVGIFLPLLPTVPFMLLAAFCFARGSQHFHDWLINHPRFGPPISDWRQAGAIRPAAKRAAMVALAASLGLSLWLGVAPAILALQVGVLGCVALFILTRPSGPPA